MNNINIGIIGAAGYTGGELIRILLNHPNVDIAFAHSKSQVGKPVYATHTDLLGDTELTFSGDDIQTLLNQTDLHVIFLCSGHGESQKFLNEYNVPESVKIIDLSTDFRDESNGFVYGLPELQREKIKTATKVANPGCFATSIQLAILPLAEAGLIKDDIHVSAVTGSTGAGQALSATTHFSWRSNNISIYKAFTHQHLTEIKMSLGKLQDGFDKAINFVPYRGDYTRGIMANVYTAYEGTLEEAKSIYKSFYASHPFTHVSDAPIDLKQVVNTNKCFINLEVHDGQLLISSIIDNLTKGASGQAVQNMNLLFDLPEDAGLRLKAPAF
ncbi:N-acetyl-gamma-glutamyl-phosphate reductase [Dyadobacter sp. CY351]|uniref:N-acetyl-gamma-glutamyl-phosphate reductase n=1 Tax=Dyadobacter sp. CY351 TaxID=2909337 RepID=UPI001F37F91D|nr:N-acetyl-gamma-glutamyl-phosphate reductase [Dyadobacter sp. CY351]MCF2516271.1 N-acetyl-gamma-glutamyl-phosphate reductase [Dyadobacter sp. CY351]